jgi:hypothetical protein
MISAMQRGFHWMIECPETNELVDATVSDSNPVFSRSKRLEIQNCSRWPERRACEQKCLNKAVTASKPAGLGPVAYSRSRESIPV